MIRCTDLSYTAGGFTILSSVTLDVAPSTLTAIVGPNGAGKSTLLRLMSGDVSPTEGSIELGGNDPSAVIPIELARTRAMLSPDQRTDLDFAVRHVVQMGRFPHRTSQEENDAIVESAMRATDVDTLADRPLSTLSTGEAQRTGLARVLAQDTPVLLLDEPTSALDLGHRALVMQHLRNRASDGTAVVAVLHDLNLAARHADRIVLIHRGSVVADGSPAEVLRDDLLSETYGHRVRVIDHPDGGSLVVT